MDKVLIVTDHVFIKKDDLIYDNFVFNNDFFCLDRSAFS